MSLLDTASLIVTPNGYKEGKLYSVIPSDGSGDMSVTRATTATRVNSAGLVESMGNNVPRLDYSNGTCPSLLVEPQRTNRLIYSEQLIQGRAWAFTSGTFTVTENTTETLDPFGNNNADKFNATTQSNNDSYTSTSGSGNLTISIFAKKGTNDSIQLYHDNVLSGGAFSATFNLTSGTITASSGTASIQDLGNGWYRCSVSGTDSNSSGNIHGVTTYTGTTYLFGVQLEQGSYATSYIPTTSASVTRNADVISKTGISSLIGQTEGTLFVDLYRPTSNSPFIFMLANSTGANAYLNSLYLYQVDTSQLTFDVFVSGALQASIATSSSGLSVGRHKIAFAYKQNDFVLYVDGTQIGTDTSGNVPTLSAFEINGADIASASNVDTNPPALWKTRLTNTQLAQLTTI
jgi:hypothetical protein